VSKSGFYAGRGDVLSTENGKSLEAALSRFLDDEMRPGDEAALVAAMETNDQFAEEVRRLLALDNLLRQAAESGPGAFLEALRTRLSAEADLDRFTQAVLDRLAEPEADRDGSPLIVPLSSQGEGQSEGEIPPDLRPTSIRQASRPSLRTSLILAAAAVVLLALGAAWWLRSSLFRPATKESPSLEVAWLMNAQNCRWTEEGAPAGDMRPGKVLRLAQGLAELHFHNGVCVVLQGPATLEIVSASSVRLIDGKLAARVPEPARGFEVLSPGGNVVDLGTEFGIAVAEDGSTQVHVFRGEVEARPAGEALADAIVRLKEEQSARIGADGVLLEPKGLGSDGFVREIVPPPLVVPRTLAFDFRHEIPGTLKDQNRQGIGLTHRLPGTRHDMRISDGLLQLHPEAGLLELDAIDNDLHRQRKLHNGEYVGVRLSDLGFTGKEDFEVTAVFLNTPWLQGMIGQLGLYAGARSDKNIRGGLIHQLGDKDGHYSQFVVHNNGGRDSQLHTVGLASSGENLRLTLQRLGGKYSLTVENLTKGVSNVLFNRHPGFLDTERDLYVGVFAAVPWHRGQEALFIKDFKATVWTLVPNPQRK
jgi:hypothetical protein